MTGDLSLGSGFFKAHGHGNDYLVFEEGEEWIVSPRTVRAVCDRHRGVGGDGIVALLAGEAPPFRLRMFNPDGSEFERSGNGLRILGGFLYSRNRISVGDPIPVEVGGESVELEILGEDGSGRLQISVEMGLARFGIQMVGGSPEAFGPGPTLPGPEGLPLDLNLVSMGNPHCVYFREQLQEGELLSLGPFLASHVAFSSGTNVQLARVVGDGDVEILIWERGVGRTTSSGTSACAVAAAAVRSGLSAPGRITIRMEGGDFVVWVTPEFGVRLEGPIQPSFSGKISKELLREMAGESD